MGVETVSKNQGTQIREEISEEYPLENEEEWANEVKKLAKQHHEKQKSHQFLQDKRFPGNAENMIAIEYSTQEVGTSLR